jgi:hypothetical protein
MLDFIDISYPSSQNPEKPYVIFLFNAGTVKEIMQYATIDSVAAYCRAHDLPIVSSSPIVRKQLSTYGIASQAFEAREIGA